jgi:CubicO group peptidase (beta-lactamase class C family)
VRILTLKRAAWTGLTEVALAVSGIDLLAQPASWCAPHSPHTVAAGPADDRLSTSTIARIDSAVAVEMRREGIPGLSIAVVTDNRLRWERGYGFADLEACVPATPATVYRLASVSKTITAAAVMQLVERGRFDLDAPIQRYVPTFPAKSAPVTARQLLSHLSGIRHYQGDEELSVREYPSLTAALAIFDRDSLLHAPGKRFTYSTYGYTLLGAALEAAAGISFVEYLHTYILAPAGITTIRDDSAAALIPFRARGYSRDSSGVIRNAAFLNSSYKTPGGGLVSTARDLARFAARLQGGDVVRPTTFAQMATKERTTDGLEVPYGYGLIIGEIQDLLPGAVWHGGVQQGFTTMVYMLPKERIALAILVNLEGVPGSLAPFTNELARIIRDEQRRGTHAKIRR